MRGASCCYFGFSYQNRIFHANAALHQGGFDDWLTIGMRKDMRAGLIPPAHLAAQVSEETDA